MGHILHGWDVSQKRMLLGKAFAAVPNGGAVIVYDAIIDDERRENAFGLLMSLNMLIETPGGFDYTGKTNFGSGSTGSPTPSTSRATSAARVSMSGAKSQSCPRSPSGGLRR